MVDRRGIGAALISPEAKAFIEGETDETPRQALRSASPKPPSRKRPARITASYQEPPNAARILDNMKVTKAFRVSHRVANALDRAHLERKLKKLEPHQLQDIAEFAIERFLRELGYLD